MLRPNWRINYGVHCEMCIDTRIFVFEKRDGCKECVAPTPVLPGDLTVTVLQVIRAGVAAG